MIAEIINQLSTSLASIPAFILLATSIILVTFWINQRNQSKICRLQKELKQARNDLKALTTTSLGVGARVLELERRQRSLADKQQQVDIYESANQPYDHAIHLAQQGKPIDDIVSMCGISRNEAELIAMMQRLEKAG